MKSKRTPAVMFLIAAVMFLITGLLGETGSNSTFVVLAVVFLVLALNAWPRSSDSDND